MEGNTGEAKLYSRSLLLRSDPIFRKSSFQQSLIVSSSFRPDLFSKKLFPLYPLRPCSRFPPTRHPTCLLPPRSHLTHSPCASLFHPPDIPPDLPPSHLPTSPMLLDIHSFTHPPSPHALSLPLPPPSPCPSLVHPPSMAHTPPLPTATQFAFPPTLHPPYLPPTPSPRALSLCPSTFHPPSIPPCLLFHPFPFYPLPQPATPLSFRIGCAVWPWPNRLSVFALPNRLRVRTRSGLHGGPLPTSVSN